MDFTQKLRQAVSSANSVLCVGLDPDPERIPRPLREKFPDEPEMIYEFCKKIIETTGSEVCAFKPNMAFFEALGHEGWRVFEEITKLIPSEKIVIADAKRGDIGNTARKYREAFFERLQIDAITLNPLMGMDTLEPFVHDDEKALFVLTMTSNGGAADFLQRRFQGRMSLGEYIAEELSKKQELVNTHLGMVVGATQTESIQPVLNAHPASHLLIPGIGAQGGSPSMLKEALKHHEGIPVINSSRAVIYAGDHEENWIEKVHAKAAEMKESLKLITRRYV
ncbi:MAG: orotidine-5'-phosphate decarboxylase [Balneolaceae bacterium]